MSNKFDDYGGNRTPIRLEVFMHVLAAKPSDRGPRFGKYKDAHTLTPPPNSDSACPRGNPQWLHEDEVDLVKVVLCRFIKAQLGGQSLINAFTQFLPQRPKLTLKKAAVRAEKIVAALSEGLKERDGPATTCTFDFLADKVTEAVAKTKEDVTKELRKSVTEELEALMDHFHERIKTQPISQPEVIAARGYTGPLYAKWNSSLRFASKKFPKKWTDHLKNNTYTNAIHACNSMLRKASSISNIPPNRKVYRGISGVNLPEQLLHAKEGGGRGGVDFGFLSTTLNRDVAVNYVGEGEMPVLFEFEVGDIDRGASISFLSQYPGEDEILIPPLSYMEVVGESFQLDTGSVIVNVYPARINCNLKGKTIEEIFSHRQKEVLSLVPYVRDALESDVPLVINAVVQELAAKAEEKGDDKKEPGEELERLRVKILQEYDDMCRDMEKDDKIYWLHEDFHYLKAMDKMIRFKHECLSKIVKACSERFQANTDPRMTSVAVASSEGWVRVLRALMTAGVPLEKIQTPDQGDTTSLMLALRNGHLEAAEVLLKPTVFAGLLNHQDQAGRSALMLASAAGLVGVNLGDESRETSALGLKKGQYLIYNRDGTRAPNKYLQVRADGFLNLDAVMDEEHEQDGNCRFMIEPYKVIGGEQTYVIYNTAGDRRPNMSVRIAGSGIAGSNGWLQCAFPISEESQRDRNSHFVIKPYKKADGEQAFLIWNIDGDDHARNQYVHVRGDGFLQAYGPMDQSYTDDGNRHFVIKPYTGGMVDQLIAYYPDLELTDNEGKSATDLAKEGGHAACVKVLEKYAQALKDAPPPMLEKGEFVIFNLDGNRHPNKYLQVNVDGNLSFNAWLDEISDGNCRFMIEPYQVVGGEQTYVIYNTAGDRRPNTYMCIKSYDGWLQCPSAAQCPMNEESKRDGRFVIKPYKVIDGVQRFLIWNSNGDFAPNKYLHVRNDGFWQAYGPMNQSHTDDRNRHFVIQPYKEVLEKYEQEIENAPTPVLNKGQYLIYNRDGTRAPNKYLQVRADGFLNLDAVMDEEHEQDGNCRFMIEPYKVIGGEQTYVIYNTAGDRRPNMSVRIAGSGIAGSNGWLQCAFPISEESQRDRNSHFVIKPYKNADGEQAFLIWNIDGDDHARNQYVHVRGDGFLQAYGPMDQSYTDDGNRHFVIKPYTGGMVD